MIRRVYACIHFTPKASKIYISMQGKQTCPYRFPSLQLSRNHPHGKIHRTIKLTNYVSPAPTHGPHLLTFHDDQDTNFIAYQQPHVLHENIP